LAELLQRRFKLVDVVEGKAMLLGAPSSRQPSSKDEHESSHQDFDPWDWFADLLAEA
jgi:hypothetical protein